MTKGRKRGLLIGLAAAGLAGVGFAVWPRGPRLELYTSPAVVFEGQTIHLQVLKPHGWVADAPLLFEAPSTMVKPRDGHRLRPTRLIYLVMYPVPSKERVGWIPRWLSRFFVREPEAEAEVELSVANNWAAKEAPLNTWRLPASGRPYVWVAEQRVKAGSVSINIRYVRNHSEEFEATYRQVCESFKLIR